MKREKKIYMLVTADKYELPLAVGTTIGELSKYDGTTANTLCSRMHRKQNGVQKGYRVVCVKED